MKISRIYLVIVLCGICILSLVFRRPLWRYVNAAILLAKGKSTVGDRLAEYGSSARARLASDFERLGIDWPGSKMTLIGLKQEQMLEVWIADDEGRFQLLQSYPILKASGHAGPKLKEGDRQVPEGFYRVESLNPNSRFHLSLRLNYPNAFDREMARRDGRQNPGSDIMIHGGRVSIGCLAMGDRSAEELFVLAAEIGPANVAVLLSPGDFRNPAVQVETAGMPDWVPALYDEIKNELNQFTQ